MFKIEGYQILDSIYESANSIVYRGIREQDNQSVILKILRQDYPTPQQRTRYKQEYEILRHLNLEGVVKAYSLQEVQRTLVIVEEDFGGKSLKIRIQDNWEVQGIIPIPEFLLIAIQTVEILGQIHAANIIHKDINPANIILHPKTRQVKIIDFGIASVLTRENPTLKNPNVLEGTLAYISPEQTGRMNRSLDYRTDFYSLGVTFYELLTGQLPFTTTDALELVHCHIAKQPDPPHELNSQIPLAVSEIVMKLMAKTPEERYESASGLKADLEKCLSQLESSGTIQAFTLGTQDISGKFQIPQKLYGREVEVATLLTAFERINQGKTELMLVAGYSGIGKSALVTEIHKPITKARGYFISGKFDQFQRNIPYSSVVNAFSQLVRQLLTETEYQLAQWREKILAALGSNAQVIIDVIPEVELIVGKQSPVPDLGSTESQNRFNLVFQNFIRAFCSQEHPLVIFLDDLQWADAATLKLMELMMTDADTTNKSFSLSSPVVGGSEGGLFLIGAYRDNEVSAAHPLMITLEDIRQQGAIINQINLNPLGLEHINQLIADSLHSDISLVKSLAKLVVQKTKGNPFFVNEFLKTLYTEKLLSFNFDSLSWKWDIDQIEAMGITDNVVDLMIGKLKKLPESTQHILRLAACMGAEFDLNTLAIICEKSAVEVFQALTIAVYLQLILAIADLDEELLIQDYKFGHDRIQQAAYALMDEEQRKAIHLQIGRLLLQNSKLEDLTEELFEIVDHFNLGIELVTQPEEQAKIAQLNLIAGQKAKAATAYRAAIDYLHTGIHLLAEDCWQSNYDITLTLYVEAMEVEYLNIHFDQAEILAEIILKHVTNLLDRIKIYELKVQIDIARDEQLRAIDTGLQALDMLGIPLSQFRDEALVKLPSLEQLATMPEMTDAAQLAGLRLLIAITPPVHHVRPNLFPQIALTIINLCVEFGLSALAAYAFGIYGLFLCAVAADVESAYHSGKLALKLIEKYHAQELKCKVYMLFGVFVCACKEHARATLLPFEEAIKSGLEVGDIEYVSYAIMAYCAYILLAGEQLEIVEQNQTKYIELLFKLKQKHCVDYTKIWRQLTLNFQKVSDQPCLLRGKEFDELEFIPRFEETHNHQSLFAAYVAKLILAFSFKDYKGAVTYATKATEHEEAAFGLLLVAVQKFYESLALLALYPKSETSEQAQFLCRVEENQKKLKYWAEHAPINYQHKYDLVEAEKARALGQNWQATKLYEQAIQGASNNGYIQEEALAYELAAQFYLDQGLEKCAQSYLKEAYYGYTHWQAWAKVKDLEARYPRLQLKSVVATSLRETSVTTTNITTSSSAESALDLASVIKASQAIGSEIVLEQLLRKLMKILIENAGAQTGFLILKTADQLLIEAAGSVDADNVTVLQSIPIGNRLPTSIINYVARTCKSVVLNEATREDNFTKDPYIQDHQPKSILCCPLSDRGNLISIVYLENNLTTGAFTPDRVEVLKILSAQAAISIENARLYQTLEDKVKERTAQLGETNEQLQQANQEIMTLNELLKAENLRMSAELEVTKQLQQMILPKHEELQSIQGLDISGFMEPADEVGGDYYDVLQHNGKVKISIGDVTGHGLESGVLMLMTQTAVRTLQESNQTDPVQFLDILNRTIYRNVQRINPDKNLTLAVLDYSDGMLNVSGQHEEIIVVRAEGKVERIDTMNLGFPIGLDEEIADLFASQQVQLNPGDVVVLYTDGITEAFDIKRKQYGIERLCEVVSRHWELSAQEIREAVIEDIRRHIGKQKVFDDITLVVLKQK